MRKLLSWIAVAALIGVGKIFAGPFGLEMGMTMEQLKPYIVDRKGFSVLVNPPQPNDNFSHYIVEVHPKFGVYSIAAFGKPIQAQPDGSSVRSKFKEIVAAIAEKYGKYELADNISSACKMIAAWNRVFGSILPEDLSGIAVYVQVQSTDTGRIIVTYLSKDSDKIKAEKKAAQDNVF